MKRKLIILAAAASLACFLGSIGLWTFCRMVGHTGMRVGVAAGWRW